VLGKLDPRALASGVFRHGAATLDQDAQVHYLRDGKTASVAVYSMGSVIVIATNGKPDASLETDARVTAPPDEITMLMAAALPLAIHREPRDVAVIGWGSGLTTHTLLGSATPRVVDSVEIERAMHDGARLFGDRVGLAYGDERSKVHFDDARTFFSTGRKSYDVIISEPSNPWVSGVASLFTHQFYRFLGQHLNERGILVQWLQSYELDDPLLATMLAALAQEYPYIDVYLTNSADLLFVSSRQPLPVLDAGSLAEPGLAAELRRVGLAGPGDYAVRRIGSRALIDALVSLSSAEPHSDFYPVVSLRAPKARFMGQATRRLQVLMGLGAPVLEMTDGRLPVAAGVPVQFTRESLGVELHWLGLGVRRALDGDESELAALDPALLERVRALRSMSAQASAPVAPWLEAAAAVAEESLSRLPAEDLEGLWIRPAWIQSGTQLEVVQRVLAAYEAAARREPAAMRAAGIAALESMDDEAPALAREQMLMIALLGTARTGTASDLRALESSHGASVPARRGYGLARAYLLAWKDSEGR